MWRNEEIYRKIGLVPEREAMYDVLRFWLDRGVDGLDGYVEYLGEDWIVANARPAPGFVMIYSNTCYAPGASEGGHADFAARTDREIELIAQIARYHRKSAPKPKHGWRRSSSRRASTRPGRGRTRTSRRSRRRPRQGPSRCCPWAGWQG